MKRIHTQFLFITTIIYVFLLIVVNSATVTRDFSTGKKEYFFNERTFTGKNLSFEFLLNEKSGVVIVDYDDGNKGIYDPECLMDVYDYLGLNEEKYKKIRYFNITDYAQKTDLYIKYSTEFLEDEVEDTDKIIQKVYSNIGDYCLYNLFYYKKPIKKITVFNDNARISKELTRQGATEIPKSCYSLKELLDFRAINIYQLIMIIFFAIGCFFSIFVYFTEFSYIKDKIRIHILNGLSFKKYVYRYLFFFILKILIIVLTVSAVFLSFTNYVFIPLKMVLLLSICTTVLYSILYTMLSIKIFKNVEKDNEIY